MQRIRFGRIIALGSAGISPDDRGTRKGLATLKARAPGEDPQLKPRVMLMPTCETCGNDYDKTFDVVMSGKTHTCDSFECAIHALAPTCKHCGIRIVGHGLEKDGTFYCCDHCAEKDGVSGLRDRV